MAAESMSQYGSQTADMINQFVSFWSQCFEHAGAQTKAMLDTLQGAKDVEDLHRRWLAALSQSLDSFMRTPMFMEMMKQNLKSMTDLKMAQDQTGQAVARHLGAPLASDITGLFERLNSIEQSILTRINKIEGRLKSIEAKVGSMVASPASGDREA